MCGCLSDCVYVSVCLCVGYMDPSANKLRHECVGEGLILIFFQNINIAWFAVFLKELNECTKIVIVLYTLVK